MWTGEIAEFGAYARRAGAALIDVVFPRTCVACECWLADARWGAGLCEVCAGEIETDRPAAFCGRCGRPVPAAAARARDCGVCKTEHFWNLRGVCCVGRYQTDALKRQLLALKLRGDQRVARVLGRSLADSVRGAAWADRVEVVVPIPMHSLKRAQRPLDHAAALATVVARGLSKPMERRVVRRTGLRASQSTKGNASQRFANIRDSFAVIGAERLRGRGVLLVDNIIVSGATVCEAARMLHKAGVREVYAAVVARSVLPGEAPGRSKVAGVGV